MDGLTVGEAAKRTGWSPRMLRYLERLGLVVPPRTSSGYRLYGLRQLNQLRSLAHLRRRFELELGD
ncbi:MAG TPA: MerR family DNA-binding transcriptional regulator, partial [Gaiellaceae bacterium]|nr:MerR family DNA-binding transcriptional regulator [Gaiellaceae bacterium]